MKTKTSFKIGGAAALLLLPRDAEELSACVRLCRDAGEAPLILGRGSNLLVKDTGLRQPVVSTEELKVLNERSPGRLFCQAGVKLQDLCLFAQKQGLTGLEFAYGIPGSAGGAAYMNAGAYGGEMKDVLRSVWAVSPEGIIRERPTEELDLSYRHSVFMEDGSAVLAMEMQLRPGDAAEIRARMDGIMERRKSKQPLECPSAGSVFRRPPGQFAGALIDQCGLKGCAVGGAQVSEKHAGFIVNAGGATAADVRALIALVQTVVEEKTGFFLEPEIEFV
jgi:UDP-N-acetylmuramate dehydrogenase